MHACPCRLIMQACAYLFISLCVPVLLAWGTNHKGQCF